MSKPLNIAVLGYGFMGKAHANAYRKVNQFFPDLEHRPVLKCLCARDADKAGKFAQTWGCLGAVVTGRGSRNAR